MKRKSKKPKRVILGSPKLEDLKLPHEEIEHFKALQEWGRRSAESNFVYGETSQQREEREQRAIEGLVAKLLGLRDHKALGRKLLQVDELPSSPLARYESFREKRKPKPKPKPKPKDRG